MGLDCLGKGVRSFMCSKRSICLLVSLITFACTGWAQIDTRSGAELAQATVTTTGAQNPARAQVANRVTANPAQASGYLTVADVPKLKDKLGQIILIRGNVNEFKASWSERAPNIVYLRDGDREVEIVYWTGPLTEGPIPNFTQKGTPIFARGEVQRYRGRLQINCEDFIENLSTEPLPARVVNAPSLNPSGTAAGQEASARAGASGNPSDKSPERIDWQPYSPLAMQDTMIRDGHVMIYARSSQVPLCPKVENAYLLHPDAYQILGPRTIFFINLDTPEGRTYAQQLSIYRVPTLMIREPDQPERKLVFTDITTPREVYEFMKSAPR